MAHFYSTVEGSKGKASRHRFKALALCEKHDVALVEAEEPEVAGEWNWLKGDRSSEGFPSKGQCALNAVEELHLT